jgi:hypothetical protein
MTDKNLLVTFKRFSHDLLYFSRKLRRFFSHKGEHQFENGLQVTRAAASCAHILNQVKEIFGPSPRPGMIEATRGNQLGELVVRSEDNTSWFIHRLVPLRTSPKDQHAMAGT